MSEPVTIIAKGHHDLTNYPAQKPEPRPIEANTHGTGVNLSSKKHPTDSNQFKGTEKPQHPNQMPPAAIEASKQKVHDLVPESRPTPASTPSLTNIPSPSPFR